jgi:hypothetical protein
VSAVIHPDDGTAQIGAQGLYRHTTCFVGNFCCAQLNRLEAETLVESLLFLMDRCSWTCYCCWQDSYSVYRSDQSQSQSHVTTVGQSASLPVRLCVRPRSGPMTNFSFSLKFSLDRWGFVILYRPLWVEDGSVIYCCFRASPAQSLSVLSSAGLKIFYCPSFWESSNMEGQVPVFISPRNKVAQLYHRALGCALPKVKFRVRLRPAVSRTVHLGVLPLLKQVTRCYIYLSDKYFLYFSCRAPSLKRCHNKKQAMMVQEHCISYTLINQKKIFDYIFF